ncbi:hypothetical protein G6F50_013266 [Rhizopus delemar]|uniref:Uncharacterized protein n=1 Tax=Rhizopus delemar TaxID=936053 RepID=A0A9P6YK25_9FUNG|nr:hypothetical protein G6F50_013266 [Rhizopus delemar]
MQDSATLLHSTPMRPTSCCLACTRMDAGLAWPNARAVTTRNTSAAASKPSSSAIKIQRAHGLPRYSHASRSAGSNSFFAAEKSPCSTARIS